MPRPFGRRVQDPGNPTSLPTAEILINRPWRISPIILLAIGLGACGSETSDEAAEDSVAAEFYSGTASAGLGAATNQARCSTCHSVDGEVRGLSGATFKDIAYLTAYKGGTAPDLLAATNACVTGWMGGTALTAQDASWVSLRAYLESISDPSVTTPNPLEPEVLADEGAYQTTYSGGDATAGQAKYQAYCAHCHDSALVVGASPAWTLDAIRTRSIGQIARKVRTSGSPPSGLTDTVDLTPGPMPFFQTPELPRVDLADIIAFILN